MPTIQERFKTLTAFGSGRRKRIAAMLNLTDEDARALSLNPNADVLSGSVESSSDAEAYGPTPEPLLGTTDDTPLNHVWVIGDVPAPEVALVNNALQYIVTWTPTESGEVLLTAPAWDGTTTPDASVQYRIYDEDPATFPSALAQSSWYMDGTIAVEFEVADPVELVADQQYWLAVLNVEGEDAIGRTQSLKEWATSVMYLGGVQLFSWRPEAEGVLSVAEGYETIAEKLSAHAEGHGCYADGFATHAEGAYTQAVGDYSHAEGGYNVANGYASHVEGGSNRSEADNPYGHVEGYANSAAGGRSSHVEGQYCRARAQAAHAEGNLTLAEGYASHAEGASTIASGGQAHAEGTSTVAEGIYSHAEGQFSKATGDASHAGGVSAHSRPAGARAIGAGAFTGGAVGEAQGVTVPLKVTTADATQTVMLCSGGDYMRAAADRVVGLRGMVAARKTDGTLGAAWQFSGAARIATDGTVTILGTPDIAPIGADAGAAAWDVDLGTASLAAIQILVTGAAATDIHWSATVDMQEVG